MYFFPFTELQKYCCMLKNNWDTILPGLYLLEGRLSDLDRLEMEFFVHVEQWFTFPKHSSFTTVTRWVVGAASPSFRRVIIYLPVKNYLKKTISWLSHHYFLTSTFFLYLFGEIAVYKVFSLETDSLVALM